MVTNLLLGVALAVTILAAACGGGEASTSVTPTVRITATPSATQAAEAGIGDDGDRRDGPILGRCDGGNSSLLDRGESLRSIPDPLRAFKE